MEACDMKAMREALRTLRQRFDNDVMAYQDRYFKFSGWHWNKKAEEAARWRDVFHELREACDAALAKPPRACDVMSQEDLTRVVISGFMKSLGIGPENQLVSQLAEAAISAAIKCAYDTQLVSKREDGAK